MATISGFLRVTFSLPVVIWVTYATPQEILASPITSSTYRPPRREMPLRTESAGVRLNEEYCIQEPLFRASLTQSLPYLIISVQKLLPVPIVTPKINRTLSCG
jgi:hypothetical protein